MTPNELLSLTSLARRAYSRAMDGVCARHGVTKMELAVLLFLANNPGHDTASELASLRGLTKSHISSSVKSLTERGLLAGAHRDGNRKTVHLTLLPAAEEVIADGQSAQQALYAATTAGLTEPQRELLHQTLMQIAENLRSSLK